MNRFHSTETILIDKIETERSQEAILILE